MPEQKTDRPLGFNTRALHAGVTPELVRLSIGLKDSDDNLWDDDIVWDIDQALESSQIL